MTHQPGSGSPESHTARFDGTRVTARNFPKMIAPATITITMHEVRMDSFRHWDSLRHVSSRLRRAMTSVPAAPMAAPSVAVKKPANMPPITSINSNSVSQTPLSETNFSRHEKTGPGGPSCGLRLHWR